MAKPSRRISPADLDSLIATLEVRVVALSECIVGAGFRLRLDGHEAPGIHYILQGTGRMYFRHAPPIKVAPHTLIVVPPNSPFQLEASPADDGATAGKLVDGNLQAVTVDSIRRFTAGDDEPRTIMICGYFRTLYGASMELFEKLAAPIVEQFVAGDQLDRKLGAALAELASQEVGANAMSAALMKQVVVALVRRSLGSMDRWVERFMALSDPQVAHAFADMVAQPGKPHTINSLAQTAHLSRSAFMARFAAATGHPPMLLLRDLRMRQAATQLLAGHYSIEQIVRHAGYASRSSFARAFRQTYGVEPSSYRGGDPVSSTH